jgi:hypothetical protein
LRRGKRVFGSMPAKLALSLPLPSNVGIMGRSIRPRLLKGAEKESSLPSSSSARLGVRLGWGGGDKHSLQGSEWGVRKVEFIVEVWFERELSDWLYARYDFLWSQKGCFSNLLLDGHRNEAHFSGLSIPWAENRVKSHWFTFTWE